MNMELKDLDFVIPVTLEKSKRKQTQEEYPIRIGISSERPDKQNERMIVKSVFDVSTINYHMQEGYVDYDHVSFRGKTPLEKAQSICGKPFDFEWIKKSNLDIPVVEVNMFKGNPYTDKVIIPAMESNNGVFGASIGGKTIRKSDAKKEKDNISNIYKIRWIHDAITPLYKAVNTDTFLEKIHKSVVGICGGFKEEYSLDDKIRNFDTLSKAMVANEGVTDYVTTQGGSALQPQSNETNIVKLNWSLMDSMMLSIKLGNVKKSKDEIIDWFKSRGMTSDYAIAYGKETYDSFEVIKSLKII